MAILSLEPLSYIRYAPPPHSITSAALPQPVFPLAQIVKLKHWPDIRHTRYRGPRSDFNHLDPFILGIRTQTRLSNLDGSLRLIRSRIRRPNPAQVPHQFETLSPSCMNRSCRSVLPRAPIESRPEKEPRQPSRYSRGLKHNQDGLRRRFYNTFLPDSTHG